MENQPQMPMVNSPQPSVVQPAVDNKSKTNSFLVILLSILLFISMLIAGFFAYQTQRLVNELQMIRNEKLVTPTPVVFTEPTIDPMADWKTYTSIQYKFSFQYPGNLDLEINEGASKNYIQLIFDKNSSNSFWIKAWVNYPANQVKYLIDTGPSGKEKISDLVWDTYMLSADEGLQTEVNSVLYSVVYPNSRLQVVKQILSTFKFIN